MGSMTQSSTTSELSSKENWQTLDDRLRRVDENRWLSSRFADVLERRAMIALYAFEYELARVHEVVSEEALGLIRFQWWRESLEGIAAWKAGGSAPRRHDVTLALADTVTAWDLDIQALGRVIDDYEAAFQNGKRVPEVCVPLLSLVLEVLAGRDEEQRTLCGEILSRVSEVAGEGGGLAGFVVPPFARPALTHWRLRGGDKTSGPLGKRWSVLMAVLTGRV